MTFSGGPLPWYAFLVIFEYHPFWASLVSALTIYAIYRLARRLIPKTPTGDKPENQPTETKSIYFLKNTNQPASLSLQYLAELRKKIEESKEFEIRITAEYSSELQYKKDKNRENTPDGVFYQRLEFILGLLDEDNIHRHKIHIETKYSLVLPENSKQNKDNTIEPGIRIEPF